ncbi:MAG: peptidase S16, lon-like protein [Piscirickettsiaceae bacterium]|nr:MAG: peptidase S16, lon-like protein [Piscirickettsiaceae bacterium]
MRMPTNNVPIFALSTVLFPEGLLSLNIFEARYLDMVSECLKQELPFGVCLITEGREMGDAAHCYSTGTLANIINWDMTDNGLLRIEAVGCQRFNIIDSSIARDQLVSATIDVLPDAIPEPIPKSLQKLSLMLRGHIKKYRPDVSVDEEKFKDAGWVSNRLSELLPMEAVMRQRLLEIDNANERLQVILGLFDKA